MFFFKEVSSAHRGCIYLIKKTLGCFNPILGQIWTNPAIELHF